MGNKKGTTNALKLKHFKFAYEYVSNGNNATQAYKTVINPDASAGTAAVTGRRLLRNANIKATIADIQKDALKAAQITAESVLARYDAWANINIFKFVKWKTVTRQRNKVKYEELQFFLKDTDKMPDELGNMIKGISQTQHGLKVEFIDQKGANDALARYLGLDKQVIEHQGEIGITIAGDESDI